MSYNRQKAKTILELYADGALTIAEVLEGISSLLGCRCPRMRLGTFIKHDTAGTPNNGTKEAMMSYEGWTQHLCAKGHFTEQDAYVDNEKCPWCKEAFVWSNRVDDTNVDAVGEILVTDLKLIEPEQHATCTHCGSSRLVNPARYEKPSDEQTRKLRRITISSMEGPKKVLLDEAFPPKEGI